MIHRLAFFQIDADHIFMQYFLPADCQELHPGEMLRTCEYTTCFRLLYGPLREGQRVLTQRLICVRFRVRRRASCSTSSWGCELLLRTQKRSSCSREAKLEWQLGHEARQPAIGGSPMQQAGLESQRLQPEALTRSGTSLRIAAHNVAFRAKYSYKIPYYSSIRPV